MRTALLLLSLLVATPAAAAKFVCITSDGSSRVTSDPSGCKTMIALPEERKDAESSPLPKSPQAKHSTPALTPSVGRPHTKASGEPQPTTKGGWIACLKKQWLDDMTQFKIQDDLESFRSYIERKHCLIMKEGLRVTVTDWPGMFGGTTGFIFKGIKFWTYREAISY